MRSLTILVDMDDVLENLVQCWTQTLNERYGTSVSEEDITNWHIAEFFPTLTKSQLFGVLQENGFWNKLSPMQNAPEVVERLIHDGHKVRVVTAAHFSTVAPKTDLLLKLYPCLKWEDVIIAHDKSLIMGDILIDDGVHNLETSTCRKFLFDRPHNRSYCEAENGITRVHNWDEIYRLVTDMAGGIE
ncbi:MAG: hypothetical protein NC548_49510 [Lachnospiraceae bacterium]|nr:hypothetical protein [Lachnospiraceae bacterium]